MTDRKPLPDSIHLDLYMDRKDAAIALMKDLIRRIGAGEITVVSVLEHESSADMQKHLEIVYLETGGTKQ
jgi:hypothetical protein